MTLRILSVLCVVLAVSVATPVSAAPIQFDGPLTVMREASKGVRLVSQGPCLSGRMFFRFTNGPARRVIYRHAYGTSEAVITCRNNRRMWIKIYPRGNKHVRFMSHGATSFVVQIKGAKGWTKVCEGSSCRRYLPHVSAAAIERWRTLDRKALRRFGNRFRNSHFVPKRFQRRATGKPLFRRGRAPLPIVFFQPHKRFQMIVPDGTAAKRLSVAGAYRSGSTSRGGAMNKPLLSPDGRWLADLVPRGVRITALRSGKSRVHSYKGRKVLIGPWAPDSTGLMLAVGRQMMTLDPRQGQTASVARNSTWGSSGQTTIVARPAGNNTSAIIATSRRTGTTRTLGTVQRQRVWLLRARGGHVVMRSMTGRIPELHVLLPNGQSRPLVIANLLAGSHKLSPNGKNVAAIIGTADRTRSYLTIINNKTGKQTRLTRCSSLCNYYWYTNNVLVIETHREISLLHFDGREHLLHRDAHLVRMRSHR